MILDWNEVGQRKSQFLKLEPGTFTIRFVGKPKRFYKYFHNSRSAITEDPDNCPIRKKFNIEPQVKFAVLVLDRADKQLKVLECSKSVLSPVAAWAKKHNADPGGDKGCDWTVEVTGRGKMRRYQVWPDSPKPFTEDELSMIQKLRDGKQLPDLDKLYAPTPPSEIETKLFAQNSTGKEGGEETPAKEEDMPF